MATAARSAMPAVRAEPPATDPKARERVGTVVGPGKLGQGKEAGTPASETFLTPRHLLFLCPFESTTPRSFWASLS